MPASHPAPPRALESITKRPWWKPVAAAIGAVLTTLDRTIVFVQLVIYFSLHDVAL